MSESAGWSLTESDPGIMTGILQELGVKGLEVEELYGLDPELLESLQPAHALIFLFKWVSSTSGPDKTDGVPKDPQVPFYFANQVINNACASIALLNAALNVSDPNVELGEELSNLAAFSDGLDSETKGWTISNSEKIRQVHNSFARSDPFHLEESQPQSNDADAYHFICYVPIGDELFELDGLKPSPISHGKIQGDVKNWTSSAKEVIERRIATYPTSEVMFNLLAITSRSTHLRNQISQLQQELQAKGGQDDLIQAQLDDLQPRLANIDEKFSDWQIENSLRRHNYVGLIHGLLLEQAKQAQLEPSVVKAKETMKKKIAERAAKGETAQSLLEED